MNDAEFTEMVHKYRNEPAHPLQFQPSIEMLIDSHHCQMLDKIIHGKGVKWERLKAIPTLAAQLPDTTGLYMFVWRPELSIRFATVSEVERFCWVLYIGKAGIEEGVKHTIKQRYQSEYSKYVAKDASCLWDSSVPVERHERLARYLTLRPLEYWFLPLTEIKDILVLEKKLIRLFGPPLNQQHGPKLRPGKAVPAFEEPKA